MCKMPSLHKCKLIMDTNYFIGCMFCLESLQVDGRWAYNWVGLWTPVYGISHVFQNEA